MTNLKIINTLDDSDARIRSDVATILRLFKSRKIPQLFFAGYDENGEFFSCGLGMQLRDISLVLDLAKHALISELFEGSSFEEM